MRNGKTALKVSDQIELRLPDLDFAEELFAIVDSQRSYLREWLPWVDQTQSVSNIISFLKSSKAYNKGGQKLTTFIFENNNLIGSIGLVKIDSAHRLAEIGYWLKEDCQGRGIITQSCDRLIQYSFSTMDINRIEIKVASPNHKSQAIPKNLNFIHEATLREALFINDQYFNLEVFSLLKRENKNRL